MEKIKIIEAIEKARKGISQYLEIMALFAGVDVSTDRDFQRKYNAFYRVRQKPEKWYREYFSAMERWKGLKPGFNEVLDHFKTSLDKYEPSFSSKLVATLNPDQPVWDVNILKNTQIKMPSYSSKKKFQQAKSAYAAIQEWYKKFLVSKDGALILNLFDQQVPEHAKITPLKKVDFVLWQTR